MHIQIYWLGTFLMSPFVSLQTNFVNKQTNKMFSWNLFTNFTLKNKQLTPINEYLDDLKRWTTLLRARISKMLTSKI
ncbi:hypothetical protein PRUPE_1G259200 [Prunus persica]|uniref:Uncharacterized protein n=1 Tax=Prunus persica TaxID=3760 RepID=M5X9V3_PRUPE|nr:hypothetical protein PRUPE_1G259200 [Prunus persica]